MQNENQWVLITGGAKRLGAELCRTLALKGFNVLIHYNHSCIEAADLVSECCTYGVKVASVHGDFASYATVNQFINRLISECPPIAYLVNNVGNYVVRSPIETEVTIWSNLFQTNLYAPIALINALLPSIRTFKGAIVNIGTVGLGNIPADVYATAYNASKLSLWMATKSYAKALACDGVRVNMVSPGMLANAVDKPSDCRILPMRRAGTLSEVARVVSFLLDIENSYITGQNIEIAGALKL